MKRLIKKGAVDQTIDIFIQNSGSTTGAGLTGLAFNTAGLTCYYRRGATGAATALTLATQTVGGVHADGGFVEIDAVNMPGFYRLDLSDAIIATGVPYVTMMLKGAANMAPVSIELQLVDFDPEDAAGLGLSRLDAAVTTRLAAASAPTNFSALSITAGGLVDITQAAADKSWSTAARALTDKAGFTLSGAGNQAIWDVSTAGPAVGSYGEKVGKLTFNAANRIEADVKEINDVAVIGAGVGGNLWRA